jgi:hypothetical protein
MICPYCNGTHSPQELCPHIESIEYYPNGQARKIVFKKAKVSPPKNTPEQTSAKEQRDLLE